MPLLAHVLVGEPDSTLGSSPRARFAGTRARAGILDVAFTEHQVDLAVLLPFFGQPLTPDEWTNAGFRRYGPTVGI
jgi:hypothetical protein